MQPPTAILFDIDDTLVDTAPSYRGAIVATAAAYGVSVTLEDVAAIKAAGDANNDWVVTWNCIRKAGVDVSLDEVTRRFEELYQGTADAPGLKERERLLVAPDRLRALARCHKLALVTGRPAKDAREFVTKYGFDDVFGAVVTYDDGPLKPDPFPVRRALELLAESTGWMVGDTPDDIRAAVAAGATGIGVVAPADDPARSRAALRAAGAAAVFDSLDALFAELDP